MAHATAPATPRGLTIGRAADRRIVNQSITPPQQATRFAETRFDRVEPELEQVRRALGLREGRGNHQRWFDVIEELTASLPRLMRLRAVYSA